MVLKISGFLMLISLIFGAATGNVTELSEAAVNGGGKAVTLTLSLVGLMCLWSGIMRTAAELGVLRFISRILSPVLKLVFPDAAKNGKASDEISAAITANILGIGNAATPLAVRAAETLSDGSGTASNDMVTFTVLGTAFPCLMPTSVIALRSAAGSASPTDIIVPVWICSFTLSVFAVMICRMIGGIGNSSRRYSSGHGGGQKKK